MSQKHNRKGRSKGQHSLFVALELFIMQSDAWRSLSVVSRQVYIEIAALYNQSNNGRLALSARQVAQRLPINRSTVTRAFKELAKKGFIVAASPSGFNMKTGERKATEWRLTRYRCDVTGDLPTKAFLKWVPDVPNPQRKEVSKIHFAAAPESHLGCTREPHKAKNGQKSTVVALPRSRPTILAKYDGCTTGPLLESTIGGTPTVGAVAAPQGAGEPQPRHTVSVSDDGFRPIRDLIDHSKLLPTENWPRSNLN